MNLLRLWQVTDSAERKAKADKTFAAFSSRLSQSPDALPQLMAAIDFGQSKPKQIIIAGKANAADTRAMLRLVHERYIPNKFLILADGGAGQARSRDGFRLSNSCARRTTRRRHTSARTIYADCRHRILRLWAGYSTARNLSNGSIARR